MYTYKCRECHEEFDEPYVFYEHHGFQQPPYEEWAVCPRCMSPDWYYKDVVDEEEEEVDEE